MLPRSSQRTIHRAKEIWTTRRIANKVEFFALQDAVMVVNEHGKVVSLGSADSLVDVPGDVVDHGSGILLPGFVDAHIHCPQLDVIGSGGFPLLEWLDHFVFPAESQFKSTSHAVRGANRLIRELKRHGVTTAAVFSTVHAQAADALFDGFDKAGLRLITGKTSMDVGAPNEILEAVESDIANQEELICKWHGKAGRLFYALTPRFALSCSREMLKALSSLKKRHPSCYVQTHISENMSEVRDVLLSWNTHKDYLGVYESYELIGDKTLLAHGIYLSDSELARMALSGASIVHCPTSNTFLGSGLFNLEKAKAAGVRVCLGSDVGAGTSLSPWQTMLECYKVQALQGNPVSAKDLLYLTTLAGAESLGLDATCGSLDVGKDADFVVIYPERNEFLGERLIVAGTPEERLFACITCGDDRIIDKVYVAGTLV